MSTRTGIEESVAPPPEGTPWTVLHLVRWSAVYLAGKGVPDPRLDAEHLLGDVLGMSRLGLYLQYDRPLTQAELEGFRVRIRERARRKPLQYVLGRAPFRDLELEVDPRVLIPRPETETLVEEVLVWVEGRGMEALAGLDVGTGSGAIALALALEGGFGKVVATDTSEDALSVARGNAARLRADEVEFRLGSLLTPVGEGERFDVLVSNPPYVRREEYGDLAPEVREWEPEAALVSGDRGVELLDQLVAGGPRVLAPGGLLALEVGEGQAKAVAEMIRGTGAFGEPRIRKDLAGRDRIVLATRDRDSRSTNWEGR